MKSYLWWSLAFLLTIALAYYQRRTGPIAPVRGSVEYKGQEVSYKLIRTWGGDDNAFITIPIDVPMATAVIRYKRFKSHDEWKEDKMKNTGGELCYFLPAQPAAGKIMYQIFLTDGDQRIALTDDPINIRFRGSVPLGVIIPHVLFMFLSMLFSFRAGMEVLRKGPKVRLLAMLATVTLFAGGLILGPVVQKYAFDAYWTGWPFGHDLTDNKTIVSFLFWLLACIIILRKPEKKGWVLAAAIIQLMIYLIPHSLLGSEIDYTQMPVQ